MLAGARAGFADATVWADKGVAGVGFEGTRVVPHFARALRRVAMPILLARLLRRPGTIFLSTATTSDLVALHVARKVVPSPRARVVALFHWYSPKARKDAFLTRFAREHPWLRIVTPDPHTTRSLEALGFKRAATIPYPRAWATPRAADPTARADRILVAGGARQDKGFAGVVAYARWLKERRERVPLTIQASANHWGEFPEGIPELVGALREINQDWLTLIDRALDPGAYAALFDHACVLQPYDPAVFAHRVSGVTLDAFEAGAPVVATAGTWSAREVESTGAGVVLASTSPEEIHRAVTLAMREYPRLHAAALAAAQAKRDEQARSPLWRILRDG